MSGKGGIARSVGLFAASGVLVSVSQLVATAYLSRVFTPAELGTVLAIQGIVVFATLISDGGISWSIIQTQPLSRTTYLKMSRVLLLMGALSSLLVFGVLTLGANSLNLKTDLVTNLAASATVLADAFAMPMASLQLRLHNAKRVASYDALCGAVGYAILPVAFTILGFGPLSIILGLLGRSALRAVLFKNRTDGIAFEDESPDRQEHRVLRESMPFLFARLGSYIYGYIDRPALSATLGPADAAIYARALQVIQVSGSLISSSIDRVMFATLARDQNNRELIVKKHLLVQASLLFIGSVMASFLAFNAKPVVLIMFGPAWLPSANLLLLLSPILVLRMLDSSDATLFRSSGHVWFRSISNMTQGILVIGAIALLARYGVTAVAIGVVAIYIVNFFFYVGLKRHLFGIGVGLQLRGLAIAATVVLAAFVVHALSSHWLSSNVAMVMDGIFAFGMAASLYVKRNRFGAFFQRMGAVT